MVRILSKSAAEKLKGGPAEVFRALMGVVLFTIATIAVVIMLTFAIAICYAVFDKGNKTLAVECGERSDCVQRNVHGIPGLLCELERFLKLAMLFSEESLSPASLREAGFAAEDVLKRVEKARVKKPAFTVVCDIESESVLVFIRGTCSFSDVLTDLSATAAPVSFKNVAVSGHAHSGMLAAARWIEDQCTPVLKQALRQHPTFKIKIIGHSLGGGTAALLTCMLREKKQFSSCTSLVFGAASCVTLELAEFGKPFITSIINGVDTVPTISISTVLDFTFQFIRDIKNFRACPDEIDDTEEDTKLDKLDKHLYPPGRIMHIVPAPSSSDEKRFYLYETPTQLYGKIRLSRRMIADHLMIEYLKVLRRLINQPEEYIEAPIWYCLCRASN